MTKFKTLYKNLNLIDDENKLVTLHKDCPFSSDCWKKAKGRMPDSNDEFWTVTRPWIGENYSELKLLIFGENFNEYGSYYGAIKNITEAKKQLKNERKITFKSPTYKGSIFYHRIALYAHAIGQIENIFELQSEHPTPKQIAQSLDYIAFTNQVKCPPIGNNSKPTKKMWNNCGNFILKKEIKLIKPKIILVVGKTDNFNYFNHKVLDNPITLKSKASIQFGIGFIDNLKLKIYVVPHPASRGGNRKAIYNELKQVST